MKQSNVSPPPDGGDTPAGQIEQSWLSNADAWTRVVREQRIESRRLATDRAILDAVLGLTPASVLDVGCGEGWLCRELEERGVRTLGIDASAPLIEKARTAGGGTFEVVSYDDLISDGSLAAGPYDVVVCNFSLLDESVAPLLGSLRTRLTRNGHLVIQTAHPTDSDSAAPYIDGWRLETFDALGEPFPSPMPWYYRTFASWSKAITEAGFEVSEVREPVHPTTQRRLSLLFLCEAAQR